MYVGNKLPITPSCPAADYVPSSSTQLRRQTGNTVSTVAISPPASRHHNHRSRRRSRRVRSLRVRRRNIALSSDKDQREVAEKGSHEAADVKEGVAPPWWRTENWKRGCKLPFFLFISIPCNRASLLFEFFASNQGGSVRGEKWLAN